MLKSRKVWLACVCVFAIMALAWIDGGEEPIHPIEQTVSAPIAESGGR